MKVISNKSYIGDEENNFAKANVMHNGHLQDTSPYMLQKCI